MATQPAPTYAAVSFAQKNRKTGLTESVFNPVWLSWFLSLSQSVDGDVNLATGVTGVLGTANGGTGQSSYTAGHVIYAATATSFSGIAGIDVTITTAKLTAGGANGSMTFTKGVLTAQTAAT
jgi:hypothetical protein